MKNYLFLALISILSFTSCKKDNPVQEIDQEQLSTATLVFTAVEKITNNGIIAYKSIEGEASQTIKFEGPSYLPEIGTHLDLHVGHTYKMELKTTDFAGRASEQSFLNRHETHQAFLLGADNTELDFTYGDENNVGITAYITIKKESTVVLNYVMRHLNTASKQTLKASDWNNSLIKLGAVDLDLKFEAHFIDEEHGH